MFKNIRRILASDYHLKQAGLAMMKMQRDEMDKYAAQKERGLKGSAFAIMAGLMRNRAVIDIENKRAMEQKLLPPPKPST